MMSAPIRLVAIDMDGTMLNSNSEITENTITTLKIAQEQGVHIVICTGRFLENVKLMLGDAGFECPVISLNGSVIEAGGEIIYQSLFTALAANKVVDALEAAGASYYMFGEKTILTRRGGKVHHAEVKYAKRLMIDYGMSFRVGREAVVQGANEPLYKFYIYEDEKSCPLETAWQHVRNVKDVDITRSSNVNFEVMPKGVNKESGIRFMADWFHIPMQQVMAIGDHENDIEMLSAAGFSIAMGNAVEEVLSIADAVTYDNNHEGVAHAINRYVLHPHPSGE